jgi:predicted AAA+ superfamily ATPase
MIIKREIESALRNWKNAPQRKPLLLQGARQTGKTWSLKRFGMTEFDNVAYFNFDENPELKQFFSQSKDIQRILQNLSLLYGKAILPGSTLIVFDEIQECNEALNALKYFNENAPAYTIVCAGSLLGVTLSRGESFPVGNVDLMHLFPLTFTEFLSVADPSLASYLDGLTVIEPLPDIFFNRLIEKLRIYFITGGMPEPVTTLLEHQDMERTQQSMINILKAYTIDFSKHIANKDIPKINSIWNSIPSQLARENKKFRYQQVKQGARAREYEDALQWLVLAGLVYKVVRSAKPALPLSAYDQISDFKLYMFDTGLLRRISSLDPVAVKEGNRLFVEFKGALSENFVLQSLLPQFEVQPRYWTSGNTAEIDFLIQHQNSIIPVEVKSDENIRGKSLTTFYKQFHPSLRIRYSLRNLRYDDGLLNIPLFLADHTRKFLEMADERS